jgi:hypothetical protein
MRVFGVNLDRRRSLDGSGRYKTLVRLHTLRESCQFPRTSKAVAGRSLGGHASHKDCVGSLTSQRENRIDEKWRG